jgi:hypothetical protein
VLSLPGLGPAMSQVNDEDQLNEDEEEAAHQPEVHPGGAKVAVRDEEGADPAADDEEILDAPETVLQAGPRQAAGQGCVFWEAVKVSPLLKWKYLQMSLG